jgi:hypothetical protein
MLDLNFKNFSYYKRPMNALLRSFSRIVIITLCALPFANVQEVRVLDTKGTISKIRNNNNNNNNVYTFATDLNTTSYKKMLGVP